MLFECLAGIQKEAFVGSSSGGSNCVCLLSFSVVTDQVPQCALLVRGLSCRIVPHQRVDAAARPTLTHSDVCFQKHKYTHVVLVGDGRKPINYDTLSLLFERLKVYFCKLPDSRIAGFNFVAKFLSSVYFLFFS